MTEELKLKQPEPNTRNMKVFLIAAVTLDGFIAETPDHPATWTSKEDKQHFVRLTKEAGVVVMGSRTFATLPRPLKDRLNVVYTRTPEKIASAENVMPTQYFPEDLIRELEAQGFSSVAICGGSEIYSMFMQAGVVTHIHLTIEPIIFGRGISLFNAKMAAAFDLVNVDRTETGTVFLEYKKL